MTKRPELALLAALLLFPAGCKRDDRDIFTSTPAANVSSVSMGIRAIDTSKAPEVSLLTQVTDNNGNVLTNLKVGDFSILEADKPVVPLSVERESGPLSLVLVIDRSGSMSSTASGTTSRNAAATTAGIALINAMAPGDEAAYVEFDDKVYVRVNFTSDKAALVSAIQAGAPGNTTAFLDGVVKGAELLAGRSGRKLMIALGDGDDNSSKNTLDNTLVKLKGKGAAVYTLILGADVVDTTNFQSVADATGGTMTISTDGSGLSAAFLGILALYNNLINIRYRHRTEGLITLYLNYGDLTATAYKDF